LRHQFGVPLLLLGNRRLVVLDRADRSLAVLICVPQRIDLGDERHQARLQPPHLDQLVLGVDHSAREAVARRLQRLELRAPDELILQLRSTSALTALRPFSRVSSVSTNGTRAVTRESCASSSATASFRRVAFCVPSSISDILPRMASILGLELRRTRGQRAHAFVEGSSAARSEPSLSRSLAISACRLVEVENLLAQQFEILPALLERIHMLDGFLRELVYLAQLLVQRVERERFFVSSSLCTKSVSKRCVEAIDLLGQHNEALVLGGQRLHTRFCVRHRTLEGAHAPSSNASNSLFLIVRVPTSDRSDSSSADESRCIFDVSRWTS